MGQLFHLVPNLKQYVLTWLSPLPKPSHPLKLKITTASTTKDPHMAVIPIHVGKNLVENMLLNGDPELILLLRIFKTNQVCLHLDLPLTPLKWQPLTKLVGLIWDFKIHMHGILYIVTFIVMRNNVLDSSYSMLFGHPQLHNAKVTHD